MEYIPQSPKQAEPPKPTYELKKDVTGKPPPVRGPAMLKIVRYDDDGKKQEGEIKVPHAPKKNCKKCHGRGYIGFKTGNKNVIPCIKCFPPQ